MSILSFRHCLSEAFRSRVFLAGSLFERGRSGQGVGCEGAFSNPVNIDKNRLMFKMHRLQEDLYLEGHNTNFRDEWWFCL